MHDREYYAFPLFEEAYLREGYKLTFDLHYRLKDSKKITPPPEELMRPTILHVARKNGGRDLLMVGGEKERLSVYYDTALDSWHWLPKLPVGHNITCNVSVNWLERAVFTFLVDGALNIKCASLPLKDLPKAASKEDVSAEWAWALRIQASKNPQSGSGALDTAKEEHNIDRFHVKCAVVMPDNSIAVVARGRYPGMREAVSTLILRFDPFEEAGVFKLKMRAHVERCFPTIFPRQLDHMQRAGQKLILVQDTPDADPFEVMSVDMTRLRRCGTNQVHKMHEITTLSEAP